MKTDKKTYYGSKIIYAEPMTRGDYNNHRGWTISLDENPHDPGYLVEYEDGGYITWSPADVFERAYLPLGVTEKMADWQVRLQAEYVQLHDRLTKLQGYLGSLKFSALKPHEKALLIRQETAMMVYANILKERVQSLPTAPSGS